MKHPAKPPKAFAALVIGVLGFTLATAYIFVSAAPTKVSEQNSQPGISKIGLITSDAKGKTSLTTYPWTGKPVAVKYSAAASSLEMFVQATNLSRKAPTWYAFDSFSLVSKVITPAMIEKMALADAPDANSPLWQKTQSATVSNMPLEKDEKRILVVYVSNADPKSVLNKGIVDAFAYIVVQDGTTELQGPLVVGQPKTDIVAKLSLNSPGGMANPSSDQVVAKFQVMNLNNPDLKSAQILKIKASPVVNFKQIPGTTRKMKLYRTETLIEQNLLGTYEFNEKSCMLGSGCEVEFDLTNKPLQSNIEAGTYQVFTITLDTKDVTPANNELYLNIGISHWTDGIIKDIEGDSKKLFFKSHKFTY